MANSVDFAQASPASLWRGSDFASKDDIAVDLTGDRVSAVLDDVKRVAARKDAVDIAPEDLPMTPLGDQLANVRDTIMNGRGIVILRGFPVAELSQREIEAFYWAVGLHLGRPVSQSVMGDRLGHVIDVAGKDKNERAYRNSNELTPHSDPGDILAFLCLRPAMQGGTSLFASSHTVHEEMRKRRPDLLQRLYKGYRWHRFGEEPEGYDPITPHRVPVYSEHNGLLSCRIVRQYVEIAADEYPECRFEPEDVEALDMFDAIAAEDGVGYWFRLEAGEAVLANNFTVLHARTAFEDDEDSTNKRHLLRLWLEGLPPRPVVDEVFVYGIGEPGIPPKPGRMPGYKNNVNFN